MEEKEKTITITPSSSRSSYSSRSTSSLISSDSSDSNNLIIIYYQLFKTSVNYNKNQQNDHLTEIA